MNPPVASEATDGFAWVKTWVAAKFGDSLTGRQYASAWSMLKRYLTEKGISGCAGITRQVCYDYLLWRADVKRNTALWELRVLSAICHEALRRNLLNANPVLALGLKRQAVSIKPELSAALMDEILATIDGMKRTHHKHFYRMSFLIGRYHGVRLSETRFPLHWVNFDENTVTFHMKGDKMHSVYLHPKLRPVLLELVKAGHAWTFAEPSDQFCMSELWHRFFARKGFTARIPGICFHCLRVTVISQLARANIPEAKAMRYVAHSSSAVHRIYQRVRVSDLADCCDALT